MPIAQAMYRGTRTAVRVIPQMGPEIHYRLALTVIRQKLHEAELEFAKSAALKLPNEDVCAIRAANLLGRKEQILKDLYRVKYE